MKFEFVSKPRFTERDVTVGVVPEHPLPRMAVINRGEYLGWLETLTSIKAGAVMKAFYDEEGETQWKEKEQPGLLCLFPGVMGANQELFEEQHKIQSGSGVKTISAKDRMLTSSH